MKKFIVSVLIIYFFIMFPGKILAIESKGEILKIIKKDRQLLMGELLAVNIKRKELLLIGHPPLNIFDLNSIYIQEKSLAITILGSIFGLGVGATIGGKITEHDILDLHGYYHGGAIGLALGTGVGASIPITKKIVIEGKSNIEITEILERLRKKARIRDYN